MLVNVDPGKDIKFGQSSDIKKIDSIIDQYDQTMLNYIANLYEAINGEKMDFGKIKNAIDALSQFNKKQEYNYLNNLLHPEKCKGVKIPSPIPVPSCSFQLHNSITLSTNSSGNLCLVFNPFFLGSNAERDASEGTYKSVMTEDSLAEADKYAINTKFFSSLYVNNDTGLTGAESNSNFIPVDIGQNIEPIYDQYRLVSASIVVKYIGRLDIVSGVIGGAVVFDETPSVGCSWGGTYDAGSGSILNISGLYADSSISKYGNFDLARDSYYHQENMALEGIRMLYFPIDNSYEEYSKILQNNVVDVILSGNSPSSPNAKFTTDNDNLKNGFRYMIYTQGAPANSACFKVDIYCNFECLPNAQYLNFLPLTLNLDTTTPREKKEAIVKIQNKPIMSLKESDDLSKSAAPPSIFDKMKSKFSNGLAPISKLMAQGLAKAVPFLKPGLSLAGSMLGMELD